MRRPGPEHLERLLVVEGDVVDVEVDPRRRLDELQRPVDDRQVAQAEEVHLEEAEVLHAVHLVLRDDRRVLQAAAGLGLALDRQVLGQRVPGDDDGGGVDPVLAAEPLEAQRHVADPLHVGVGLVEVAQLAGHLVAVLELVLPLEAGVERRVAAHDQRGHELGDLVADGVGIAEHPGRVPHRRPGLDRRERDDLGDVVGAVALGGVADHLAAVALVEVHVDVGHLLAAGVEEPLEEQAVAERVEVDDPQAVGHGTPGRRPPARADPDAAVAGVLDEVPHHEEVGREPHLGDDAELVVDPLAGPRRGAVRRSAGGRPPRSAPGGRRPASEPSGQGNDGSAALPNSMSTLARSAIHSVLSQASGTSANSDRISADDFR